MPFVRIYRRALAITEKGFSPDYPNVARDLNNLALRVCCTARALKFLYP
jgi:hypothetical protein